MKSTNRPMLLSIGLAFLLFIASSGRGLTEPALPLESADAMEGAITIEVLDTSQTAHGADSKAPVRDKCRIKADDPHWSNGAGSVIYKTRVACEGQDPFVTVQISGSLWSIAAPPPPSDPPQGPPILRTQSRESRKILTTGGVATFYTPAKGDKKVKFDGWYSGQSGGVITAPVSSNTGTDSSNRVFVNVP